MEPNNETLRDSVELPQPQDGGGVMPESAAAAPEIQNMAPASQTQSVQPVATNPLAPMTVPSQAVPSASNSQLTQHLIADDSDLIEKEWVMKAKAIVAHTKDDPHRQNEEMTKVKADYLKKRYNKDLKGSEG